MPQRLSAESLAIIRDVLSGKIPRDQLRTIRQRRQQVYAAIALMLLDRAIYLRPDNQVIGSLGEHLITIINDPVLVNPNALTGLSRQAGFHEAQRSPVGGTEESMWIVRLTPPPELQALVQEFGGEAPSTNNSTRRADAIFQQLLPEDTTVLREVYYRLRRHLDDLGTTIG